MMDGRSRVDLVWLGGSGAPPWTLGSVFPSAAGAEAVSRCVETVLARSTADACLFWHGRLGAPPDADRIREALSRPGDLWHGGLALGLAGLPALMDFVVPTWMLNRDPDPSIEATSWRVSLEACLVKMDVLRRMGAPRADFETLEAASLEFGHRCVTRGVLTRHVPGLVAGAPASAAAKIPFEDELRFLAHRYPSAWSRWALLRAVWTGHVGPVRAFSARRILRESRPARPAPFHGPSSDATPAAAVRRAVTVLIPTVDRYPYLRKLLDQLRRQTAPLHEIVIVDQTSAERRDPALARDFSDLPLRLLSLDRAGQCSSRNLGIAASSGDAILFLDDDDEVPPELIERHLRSLARFGGEISCGVADEVGAGPLPEAFRLHRTSDVFPTNNSLIVKDVLARSGLFDLAYDRGPRADGDLGMRLYLGGALMVLNPEISVLHHHAPSGGLRTHRARVVTYASSRGRLTHRHFPATTEIYLAKRYFSPRQVRETLWQRAFGTFRGRGSLGYRLAKAAVAAVLLPHTLWRIRERSRIADAMLRTFPQIPPYSHGPAEPART